MKNNLLLAMAVATLGLSTPPDSQAYTIDEIIPGGEGYAFEIFTTSYDLGRKPNQTCATLFKKISDTKLQITNVAESGYSFTFTLMKDGVESADGDYFRLANTQTADNNSQWKLVYAKFLNVSYSGKGNYDIVANTGGYYVDMHITQNMDGSYHCETPSGIGVALTSNRENTVPAARIFETMSWDFFQPEAFCTHKKTTYWVNNYSGQYGPNTPVNETFPVRFIINEQDNTLEIGNLANIGYAVDRNFNPYFFKATLNPADNTFTFDEDQDGKMVSLIESGWYQSTLYWLAFKLRRFDEAAGETYSDLTGTYHIGQPAHNDAEHGWVTNNGSRKTYDDLYAKIADPFTFNFIESYGGHPQGWINGNLNFLDKYEETEFHGGEVTLDVDLNITDFRWNTTDGMAVGGNTKTNKNDKYVDHYDIMVVKGRYNSINQDGFECHPDLGHAKALMVIGNDGSASTQTKAKAAAPKAHDLEFSKVTSIADLGDQYSDKGEYTFFIRATYKPETGLSPTYHSMQFIQNDVPTGIDDLEAEIEDADAPVEYYNMMGVRVQEPVEGEIYVRRQGTKAEKVIYRH